ncbi:DUF421 domain-containing protein [Halobacillus sp. K22]|uniref:DUF421 domain-containing protein n=1 Tax=Halobacillus sp. K22 TaxID=3457431 RepID=UPI003FCC60ED
MEFFLSQESLNHFQWVMRAVVGFLFLIGIAKMMGQRSISQLRFLDFVMALLIGNIMAHPLSDEGLGLMGSMITMGTLTILYLAGIFLTLRWPPLRRIFDPPPLTLVKNGEIYYRNLKKARITIENLMSELRKEKVDNVQKVALALWEPGGSISLFTEPKYQPLTPSDMGMAVKPFDLPRIIIKEGRINDNELNFLGYDLRWLKQQLNSQKVSLTNVLLATVDHEGSLTICLYR